MPVSRHSLKVSKLLTRVLTEIVCKPETLRVLGLNVPDGTFNGSFVSGCPGFESGREIGRELAGSARTLGKVAGNGKRPLTGFRLTGVNWFGGCSAGFQMSSPCLIRFELFSAHRRSITGCIIRRFRKVPMLLELIRCCEIPARNDFE